MTENSEYDQKSLKLIQGSTTNWDELAKDCVAFANGNGGIIYLGIEDGEGEPPKNQKIPNSLIEKIRKTIPQRTFSVGMIVTKVRRKNGGEIIQLEVMRSIQSIASTSNGKYYIRIADESKPLMPDELIRVASEKQAFVWEEKMLMIYYGINYLIG